MKYNRIYVAATSQHIGKTTSTLGLIHALRQKGMNVGYCKPVGQEFIELAERGLPPVDKDAILFEMDMGFKIDPMTHSPIIIGRGATSKYLDNPSAFNYRERIHAAADTLDKLHDVVVYEGTGHPGVGTVIELSNAEVAKMLGAGVVMVAKGGIGNTIDKLDLSLSLFREKNVPVIGVIINKVRKDKIEKIRSYVGRWLEQNNLPLLGVIPYDKTLSNPLMITIKDAINGEVLMNSGFLDNQVEDIVAGSLVDRRELKRMNNLLLVVSITRLEEALQKIKAISDRVNQSESPLSGIIVTNVGEITKGAKQYIKRHKIPLVRTPLDTFGSVVKISRIEVKINTRTPWKVKRAKNLIEKNVDLGILYG